MTKLFDRMLRLKKNMRKDNRGTTLVEIIVALLILVLIFTPAYMAFSAALKLNQASKDKLYAQTIAQNAMEIIKYTMDIGGDVGKIDFSTLSGSAIASLNGVEGLTAVSGSAVNDRGTDGAVYEFSGCPEGTSNYDVKISINNHENVGSMQKFADMSAFNDTATALINPSGIAGGFDSSVVDYFWVLHKTYQNSLFQQEYNEIQTHNNNLLDDLSYRNTLHRIAGEPEEAAPAYDVPGGRNPNLLWADPAGMTVLPTNEIADKIRKTMKVTLGKNASVAGITYQIDSTMEYTLNDNTMSGGGQLIDTDSYNDLPMPVGSYCDNVRYEQLDNLFIMYTPVAAQKAGVTSSSTIELEDEVINIFNNIPKVDPDDSINVFIVVQAPEGKTLVSRPGEFTVNVDGAAGCKKLKVFCNVDFAFGLQDNAEKYFSTDPSSPNYGDPHSLIDEEKKIELIYDVDIDVKETGTAGGPIRLSSSVTKN